MKAALYRLTFVLLTAATMVFTSEKVYWYVQGYPVVELILFYALPVYASLWALEYFRARSLASLVLIAALYGFLVEGVLTPVIYENGLLDPVMPAYFVGWHGLLSVVFGWYLLHRWLVRGQWKRILVGGSLFGLFWGTWSLTYWLPENIAEFEALLAQGEPVIPGAWPAVDFALYVFTFTLILAAAHWLLGRFWLTSFQPSRWEKWIIGLGLGALFGLMVLPVQPLAFLKLAALLGLIYLGLRANLRREAAGSLLADLAGPIRPGHTLALLAMPTLASLVYALAVAIQPSQEALRAMLAITPPVQSFVGGAAFVWALAALWFGQKTGP